MSRSYRLGATAFAASLALSVALLAAMSTGYAQQPKQAAPQTSQEPASPQPQELKQVQLTDKQIQGLLDSQAEIDGITSKLPDDPNKPPDARMMAQLDVIAKKHGFASYAEYGNVAANVDMLLDGFDPQTKKFIGFEAVLKGQIAQIQADTKISAKDKTEALDELNGALKNIPTVQFPANIELVSKYYDKLNDALRAQE